MYFAVEPKTSKQDFFNYASEYGEAKKALERRDKLTAVLGVRRVGKTSLLNILFNETRDLKTWVDGRIVSEPKKEIFSAVFEVAKTGKPMIFGSIESLNVSAFGIGLGIKPASETLAAVEKKIREAKQLTVFIDEAQRMDRKELADVLSYFYDRFPNVCFIISGSEVGLLEEVLGENDSEHALYGRSITKITMKRLDKSKSVEFLESGFQQAGFRISKEEITQAVGELDGLIGWLTLYGHEKAVLKNQDALNKTKEIASQIAASELNHFLKKARNKKLYTGILRNAVGISWSELRFQASKELKKDLNPNLFSYALEKLVKYSFIEKSDGKYQLADPIIAKALFLL